jgi:four helix bundle protein
MARSAIKPATTGPFVRESWWPADCHVDGMGAQDFTELVAWQLADQLDSFVSLLLERRNWRDPTLMQQISDSAASAPRNIAEGYGRFGPAEFGQFLRIAIASEFETKNHLLKAEKDGYITAPERDEGVILVKRASKAAIELRRYVLSPKGRENARRIESRGRKHRESEP